MPKVLFMYPNKMFLDFMKNYLSRSSYEVVTGNDGASIYNTAAKANPDLILIGRSLPNLELSSFLFKKKVSNTLKKIPVYLVGNFSSQEILAMKEYQIEAYISSPINPPALLERINAEFNYQKLSFDRKTPMLTDLHVKGKIFVIQIEANLEPDKIDILNYKIRSYCATNKIRDPRFFYIIPSIYPDTVTAENLDILFNVTAYPELSINPRQIKILTRNEVFLKALEKSPIFSMFEPVPDYLYGIERLSIDFDNMKTIPVNYLSAGSRYALDLYDESGEKRLPAKTVISSEIIDYFKSSGMTHLVYYSAKDLGDIQDNADENDAFATDVDVASSVLNQKDTMANESIVNETSAEKMSLFFNKIKGMNCLVITDKKEDAAFMREALRENLSVHVEYSGAGILEKISERKYIMIFIDIDQNNPGALELLTQIRTVASRRKTTVIITARTITIASVQKFRNAGTDYVLVHPFTKQKLLTKIFEFVTEDRDN